MVCEVLAVHWSDNVINYYSWARYDELVGFTDLPLKPVEARLISGGFHQFEINSDLRTENISVTFDDLDKDITKKFQKYKIARCEFFYYYPDVDLLVSLFWGQLNEPQIYGYKTIQTTITNGFRSRELSMPRRTRPKHCTATFGGKFASQDELYTNGCPYDLQLGGTTGLLDPATNQPFKNCPRLTAADCVARFGHDNYYLGFDVTAYPAATGSGYLATSRDNTSNLKQPIRVILGRKHVRNLPVLAWRVDDAARDYIRGLWEIGEGRIEYCFNVSLNGVPSRPEHTSFRPGGRGQPPMPRFEPLNFSGTAFLTALFGTPNGKSGNNTSGDKLEAFAAIHGFNEIAVFSDPNTFTRNVTNTAGRLNANTNFAWTLLECFTNKRWGLNYSHSHFDIQSFIDTAVWCDDRTSFTHPNGTVYENTVINGNYEAYRASFSAVLDARPSHEVINDMCRSMRVSVPFQHEGKYHITPIAAVSQEKLNNARVFTDKGDGRNIVWEKGMPLINFSQIPSKELCNHIVLTYEDGRNTDVERPITVDDPDQKAIAGAALGDNNFVEVPKRYGAFGIRFLNEAIKLAFSLLWFGEFDRGGIKNNLSVEFALPFEQILGLKKFDVIKIESDLNTFKSPEGNPFEFFRIQRIRKIGNGLVSVVAQAYNKEIYAAFETVLSGRDNFLQPKSPPMSANKNLPVERLQFGDAPYYKNGNIVIPPISQGQE